LRRLDSTAACTNCTPRKPSLPVGTAMFCGTVPVHGKIGRSAAFEMELHDPVLNRTLTHTYRVEMLPDRG